MFLGDAKQAFWHEVDKDSEAVVIKIGNKEGKQDNLNALSEGLTVRALSFMEKEA